VEVLERLIKPLLLCLGLKAEAAPDSLVSVIERGNNGGLRESTEGGAGCGRRGLICARSRNWKSHLTDTADDGSPGDN
jgi:hypothetical protein